MIIRGSKLSQPLSKRHADELNGVFAYTWKGKSRLIIKGEYYVIEAKNVFCIKSRVCLSPFISRKTSQSCYSTLPPTRVKKVSFCVRLCSLISNNRQKKTSAGATTPFTYTFLDKHNNKPHSLQPCMSTSPYNLISSYLLKTINDLNRDPSKTWQTHRSGAVKKNGPVSGAFSPSLDMILSKSTERTEALYSGPTTFHLAHYELMSCVCPITIPQ